jgi:hemerythrin-like domain-containing protein
MDVSAIEDLYQEHGVLNRLLLIYEEFINIKNINKKLLLVTALIIKKFVEEYHEISEETYIFPLIKDKKLVDELIRQHTISRGITSKILEW